MASFIMSQEVMEMCQTGWKEADSEGVGVIELDDLPEAFKAMGKACTKDEINVVLEAAGLHGGAAANAAPVLLDFDDFAGVVLEMLKFKSVQAEKDEEALGAFVTLGGGMEGEKVQAEALRDFVKQFELAIDIDALIRSVDSDGSGSLELAEFRDIMSEAPHAGMLQNAARHAQGPPSIFATGEYRGPKERPLRAAKPSASNNASTPKQTAKNPLLEAEEDDEETRIRRTRKRFEFMDSLDKQYRQLSQRPHSDTVRSSSRLSKGSKGSPSARGSSRTVLR